jgi:hypothetical protein
VARKCFILGMVSSVALFTTYSPKYLSILFPDHFACKMGLQTMIGVMSHQGSHYLYKIIGVHKG